MTDDMTTLPRTHNLGWLRRRSRALRRWWEGLAVERGALMAEIAVSIAILAVVGSAVVVGVSNVHGSGAKVESQSMEENIVRNQLEYVFSLPYQDPPSDYPLIDVPEGYSVTAEAQEYDAYPPGAVAIQKVVVTATAPSGHSLVIETLRTK